MLLGFVAGCAPADRSITERTVAAELGPTTPKRITAAMMGNPPTVVQRTIGGIVGNIPGIAQLEQVLSPGLSSAVDGGARQALLADAVPSVENGQWVVLPDGRMETTWRIRSGARWHDGTPITADDVLFTARVDQDKEFPIPRDPAYDVIERMDAVDASTVKITWKRPFIEADQFMQGALFPRHLLERSYEEAKGGLMSLPYWTSDFVGTGPFKVREWVRDSHVVLEANDSYPLGRTKIDEMVIRFLEDENAFMATILSGGVDVTLGKSITLEQTLSIKAQWPDGHVEISPTTAMKLWPQLLDPNPAILTNVQFRKALMYGTDRREMVETIMGGLSEVAHTVLLPNEPEMKEVDAALVKYEYDPRRAVTMIEGLGYVRGSDGIFRDAAGQRLSLEVNATGEDQNTKPMFAVKDYWQRIGVDVDSLVIPVQRQRDLEYRATFPGFSLSGGPSGVAAVKNQQSSQARLPETRYTGNNYSRYLNPEFDGLVDRYLTTVPWNERMEALRAAVRHMTDQLPQMNLYYATTSVMVANRMLNVGTGLTWNVHQWDVK
jgi:peptide/nickel transport system substrate-binding protein